MPKCRTCKAPSSCSPRAIPPSTNSCILVLLLSQRQLGGKRVFKGGSYLDGPCFICLLSHKLLPACFVWLLQTNRPTESHPRLPVSVYPRNQSKLLTEAKAKEHPYCVRPRSIRAMFSATFVQPLLRLFSCIGLFHSPLVSECH